MSALIARLVDCSGIVADLIFLVFDRQTTEVFAISVLREGAIDSLPLWADRAGNGDTGINSLEINLLGVTRQLIRPTDPHSRCKPHYKNGKWLQPHHLLKSYLQVQPLPAFSMPLTSVLRNSHNEI